MSFLSSWRTALRIAWRESARAKGRSALVVTMIALPVLALTFAAVSYDMFTLTATEKIDRTMGAADARIRWESHRLIQQMPDPDRATAIVWDGAPPQPVADNGGDPRDQPGTTAELLAALPSGSHVLPVRRGTVQVRRGEGIAQPDAVMVDATNPLVRGYVEVVEGRAPTGRDEVALTEQAMVRFGTTIGGTIAAAATERVYTVVGRVEFPSLLDSVLLFAFDPDEQGVATWFHAWDRTWLVDTPGPVTWDQVLDLNRLGMVVWSRAVLLDPPPDDLVPMAQQQYGGIPVDPEEFAIGVLVGGLALLEVVLLAGPAFAISARRRQRQLALVAANGGTPAHVRRIVLADGVVLGLLGAGAGIVVGIAAAFFARPFIEETLAHARAGGYRVFPLALLAITVFAVITGLLAALVPAFATARQHVVSALAGRRGVTRSRKRWIAVGLAMIGIGTAVTVFGAVEREASVMLFGLVVGELGLVLCTPSLVGLIARAGRLLPLGPRIALRNAARNRAAAAPAISAVMAAVAGSVALGMGMDSAQAQEAKYHYQQYPTGTVTVWYGVGEHEDEATVRARLEAALRSTLPVGEIYQVRTIRCAGPSRRDSTAFCVLMPVLNDACPQLRGQQRGEELSIEERRAAAANPHCDIRALYGGVLVDDGTGLAAWTGASGDDLARAQQTLRDGGVVVSSGVHITDGKVTLGVSRPDPSAPTASDGAMIGYSPLGLPEVPGNVITTTTVPGHLLTTAYRAGLVVVPPSLVTSLGLAVEPTTELIAPTTRMPEAAEEERFAAALETLGAGGTVEHGYRVQHDPILWVLVAAAALISLGAAAIGTGLAAADSRPDLSTLAAVGASPRVRRVLSLSQAWVIAGLGALLGALAGIGTASAVILAENSDPRRIWPGGGPAPLVLPWSTLAVMLVATPLVAILGAGLLTRSRLPIERRI